MKPTGYQRQESCRVWLSPKRVFGQAPPSAAAASALALVADLILDIY